MQRLSTAANWKNLFLTRNSLPYVFLFAFIAIPLLGLFHHDFWDGSRVGYAQDSNDFTGVRFWLFSASMEGQYFQEYLLNQVADFMKISPQLLGHMLVVASLFILIREVTIFAKEYLLIRSQLIFIPGLIVAIFPSLSLTVSSILVYYVSCLSIGWLCARKFTEATGAWRVLAFLGMIYTFEYAVMILVCPVLVLFYQVNINGRKKTKNLRDFRLSIFVTLSAIGFKMFLLAFNQPEGPMLGYNKINIPLNFTELSQLAYGIKSYSSFLLYPILVIFPVWLWSYTKGQGKQTSKIERNQSNVNRVLLIVLLLTSVAPYLLVGKSTSLFWLDFWSGRHSFALIPALALFSISILDWFLDQVSPISRKQLNMVSACVSIIIISLNSLLLFRVLGFKYLEQQNRLGIIQSLERVTDDILPGVAIVYVKDSEFLELNPYESSYLMYKVKGNLETFTLISTSTVEPEIPGEIFSGSPSQAWTLYNFPKKVCRTEIHISRVSQFSKFPNLVLSPKYKVERIKSTCPE